MTEVEEDGGALAVRRGDLRSCGASRRDGPAADLPFLVRSCRRWLPVAASLSLSETLSIHRAPTMVVEMASSTHKQHDGAPLAAEGGV